MAISKTIIMDNGLVIQNAYIKVIHLDGNKNNLYFNIQVYVSKAIADADTNNRNYLGPIVGYIIVPDLESEDNFIAQAYNYLKTLPEFSTAIDV